MTGVANLTETRAGKREKDTSAFAQARWLAGQEIKRSRFSYPVTALTMLVAGWFVASSVEGVFIVEGLGEEGRTFEDSFNAFFADFLFLSFGALLTVNWMAREYFRVFSGDAFSERLAFMRGLPISAATLVVGRLISMCFSLLLNAPAFFVPVYLISNLSGLGWDFPWFATVWVGYSLLGTGLCLLAEFTIHGKTYVWLSCACTFLLIPVVILLEWTVDLRLVTRIAGLTEAYGPLPALVALLIGATALVILTNVAIRRVERRDLYV